MQRNITIGNEEEMVNTFLSNSQEFKQMKKLFLSSDNNNDSLKELITLLSEAKTLKGLYRILPSEKNIQDPVFKVLGSSGIKALFYGLSFFSQEANLAHCAMQMKSKIEKFMIENNYDVLSLKVDEPSGGVYLLKS